MNLTGEQIQKVLDMPLYKALYPIILNTTAFDSQVSYLLAVASSNKKRKLSSIDREVLIENLCSYLVLTDREQKFECIKTCRLGRSFVHSFIQNFLASNEEFLTQYREFTCSPSTEKKVHVNDLAYILGECSDRTKLYNTVVDAKEYLNLFYSYRAEVVEQYLKFATSQAKLHMNSNSGINIDFHDLRQNIYKAIIVALDKYDYSRGALTSYIGWWVLNAKKSVTDHEYGIAYSLPQAQKQKIATGNSNDVNFSVSLDSLSDDDSENKDLHEILSGSTELEQEVSIDQETVNTRQLIKSVDVKGIAMLLLDIEESFTSDEKQAMRIQMLREQNGKL